MHEREAVWTLGWLVGVDPRRFRPCWDRPEGADGVRWDAFEGIAEDWELSQPSCTCPFAQQRDKVRRLIVASPKYHSLSTLAKPRR